MFKIRFCRVTGMVAITAALSLITGCGGGLGGVAVFNGPATIIVSGASTLQKGIATKSVNATDDFRFVPVQIDGFVDSGITLPLGLSISEGQTVAVVRNNSNLLKAKYASGQQLLVANEPTGIFLNAATGALEGNMALPAGEYEFTTPGPTIGPNTSGGASQLISRFEFNYVVNDDGTTSFPISIDARLPGRNETLKGSRIQLNFDPNSPSVNGMTATILIEFEGTVIERHQVVQNFQAVFEELGTDANIVRNVNRLRIEVKNSGG